MRRYVVRGKGENGLAATAAPDPAEDDRIDGHLPATDGRFATFATIDDAEQARRDLVGWGCTDVRIYDADTGAVVPTYGEALARLAQIAAADKLADPAARPESGPMRFGDDWAGVFLRGDYAGPMAMYLRQVLGDEDVRKRHPFSQRMLDGLASTLAGCDESGALAGLQQMRPFAECVAPGAAVRILSTAEIFAPMSPEDSVAADVAEMIHEESDAWPARGDHERLAAAHGRIAAMPKEKQHEAMRRASRSYSAPWTCMEYDGCRRDGNDIVWPDGERWPTRTGR